VHSRGKARISGLPARAVAALIAAFVLVAPSSEVLAQSAAVEAAGSGRPVTEAEIQASIAKVRKDPKLADARTIKTLRWVEDGKKPEQKKPGWFAQLMSWFGDLFAMLVGSGRVLFWVVLAVLAGLLLVYLWRLARSLGIGERVPRVEAPSFVRDLDIRPESLPDDIGAAARRLWDSGEHRGALALLYRGLLSRLVHVYKVPIKDSSTEGDCIALASRHLDSEERKIYVSSLVRVWQRAVYGGENIPTESVATLCDEFSRAMDPPPAAAAGAQPAGAHA
jgi:hypothetical protein